MSKNETGFSFSKIVMFTNRVLGTFSEYNAMSNLNVSKWLLYVISISFTVSVSLAVRMSNCTDCNSVLISDHCAEEIEFTKLETTVTFEAGSSAVVACAASGKPKPEMSWRFDNHKIAFGEFTLQR